jgi:hypothetical protein
VKLKLEPFQKNLKKENRRFFVKVKNPPTLGNTMIPLFHNGKTRIKY